MYVSDAEIHALVQRSYFLHKDTRLKPCTLVQSHCCSSTCVWAPVFTGACVPAPAKPTHRPQAMLSHGGVAMVTHRSITIHMPACFYSDDNGPIKKIQVIVAESGGKKPWQPSLLFKYARVSVFFSLQASRGISCYSTSLYANLT